MKNYLFAKFFQHLSVEELMETCVELKLDGPTALIRSGYWTDPENIEVSLPKFVACANEHGLSVEYADTPYNMHDLPKLDRELKVLVDNGIKMFRVNYIPKESAPARELADILADGAKKAASAAERHGLRAIIQLHGNFYPHNATAVWPAVKELDPRYIGVKLDPGNNLEQEGYERFDYQIELLGEYIAAIGQKDAELVRLGDSDRGAKGWKRVFAPAQRGIADYDMIFREFKNNGLAPVGILMPFYHEKEYEKLLSEFRKEIAYFKRCQNEAGM